MERTVWASPVDIPGQPRLWQIRSGTHFGACYWERTLGDPTTADRALAMLQHLKDRWTVRG